MAATQPDWISRVCVGFYLLVHGRLHLRGAGWLLRRCAKRWAGLQRFPFRVPEVGTAVLDLRDDAAYGMINASLGELENDAALVRAFQVFLRPGDTVWDIGANVGHIAQILLRPPFALARLEAFEPNPVPFRTLQSLLQDHARAQAHRIALGASNETLTLNVLAHGSTLGSLVRDLPGGQSVSVPVFRGDDYRREHQLCAPTLIKIDVEGFEPQVLAGLSETIREAHPIVVFEHIWLTDEQVRNQVPADYDLVFLADDGTITRDITRRLRGANAALVPVGQQHLLDAFSAD